MAEWRREYARSREREIDVDLEEEDDGRMISLQKEMQDMSSPVKKKQHRCTDTDPFGISPVKRPPVLIDLESSEGWSEDEGEDQLGKSSVSTCSRDKSGPKIIDLECSEPWIEDEGEEVETSSDGTRSPSILEACIQSEDDPGEEGEENSGENRDPSDEEDALNTVNMDKRTLKTSWIPHENDPPERYRGDENKPYFYKGKLPDISLDDCMQILSNEHSKDYICTKQPLRVQQNAVFLINTSTIKLQDLSADDNGSYKNNGLRTWAYEVYRDEKGEVKNKLIKRGNLKPEERLPHKNYLTIKRRYRKNAACEDFQQIVTFVEESGGIINSSLALLQYRFVRGDERSFRVLSHGNKKDKAVPFLPVNASTREQIKGAVKHQKPAKAMKELSDNSNLLSVHGSSDLPRDMKQIYNMRMSAKRQENEERGVPVMKQSGRDKLHAVMIMAVSEQDNDEERHIHGVTAWPEPMCLVGLPYQFHDISRFCCNEYQFEPLSIDTTFNLGEFYVTPTAYKNLLFENARDGRSPTFIGPTLIHTQRTYSSYCHLASKLKETDNGISELKGVVTDGEPGLIKALNVFYSESPLFRCSRHFRENCQDKMASIGIKGREQSYFLDAIFGNTVDDTRHEGLLDVEDDEVFDALLMSLEQEMDRKELELQGAQVAAPQFFPWLKKHATMMKSCLTKGAKKRAGLGPANITTNMSESVNHVLKEAAGYEEMGLPEFIALSKAMAESQRQEQLRAIIRKGKYRFREEFKFLEIPESTWIHDMTQTQRQHHLQKVMNTELDAARGHNPPPSSSPLSLTYSQAGLTHISGTVLASIWSKASEYLETTHSIAQVPAETEDALKFLVQSRSSSTPHTVTLADNGMMTCTCLMYKSSPNICSHTVSTAQKVDMLSTFLDWVKASNTKASMYDIAMGNVNRRAAGQKGGRPRRVRQSVPSSTVTKSVRAENWILGSTNTTPVSVRSPTTQTSMTSTNAQYLHQGYGFQHLPVNPIVSPPQVVGYQHPVALPALNPVHSAEHKPWHNNNPFLILPLSARVKKCTGCPFQFRDPLGPPFLGFVVKHCERSIYPGKDGQLHISGESNHYYHCDPACILGRHPYFHPRLLVLAPGTVLDPTQAAMIQSQFGSRF